MMKRNAKICALIAFSISLITTLTAQEKIAITIYNQNLALVYEQRELSIPSGLNAISFPEVAAQIDPTSVQISVLNDPATCLIREQNYEYDLVNSDKIFNKFLEKEIAFSTKSSGEIKGILLSAGGGDFVLRNTDGSLLVLSKSDILATSFPSLPDGLKARPTLVWLAQNSGNVRRTVEVSYLTRGIQWHAEYVGVLDEKDANLKLNGWVSIDNQSGANYKDAKLKLVAGDVNLVDERRQPVFKGRTEALAMVADAPQFEEKSFFEYHLYTLQRPATLQENQIKQITFFPESKTQVQKEFVYEAQKDQRSVNVQVVFKNAKEAGLGMPLPEGKVRIYKSDSDGSQIFVGEDRISHTPKDEEIRLTIGKAFDIVGERQQLRDEALGRRAREQEFEIKLRNHKDDDVTVKVIERFYGDWEIRSASQQPVSKTAEKAEWQVRLPKNGETTLQFTVRLRW